MSHEHKVREFYDSAVHAYQSIMGYTWHHGDPAAEARGLSVLEAAQVLEERLLAESGLKPGGRALDFGSGVGGPTLHMAKVSGAIFVGLSNNEGLSQTARARAAELGLSDTVSFLTTGDDDYKKLLAFADDSFDAVTFYESVCHLPDKAALFHAVFRILKPGGRLVGIDWLKRPFGENQTEQQIMHFIQPVNEYIRIPWHGTLGGYKKMIEDAGFQVLVMKDLSKASNAGAAPQRRATAMAQLRRTRSGAVSQRQSGTGRRARLGRLHDRHVRCGETALSAQRVGEPLHALRGAQIRRYLGPASGSRPDRISA